MTIVGYANPGGPLWEVIISAATYARLLALTAEYVPGVPSWTATRELGPGRVGVSTHNPDWFISLEKQVHDANPR